MKNIGDKVKIKSIKWYNDNKNEFGDIYVKCNFVSEMKKYCGKDAKITNIFNGFRYRINIDNGKYWWSEPMFDLKYDRREKLKIIYKNSNEERI